MHGDHIIPWSQAGPTTVDNLQALCSSCNLRKGSEPQQIIEQHFRVDLLTPSNSTLRHWQQLAMPITIDQITKEPVLIEACPGAGKTRFGLEVTFRLVEAGAISRVLVVVPTLAIADGWQQAASAASPGTPTLPLRSQRDWRPVDPIGDDWLGAVTTYQSLFSSTEMFLAHATDPGHRTLVIFDEVHHAGTDGAWGTSAQEAFASGASAILSLSGTPFRTNRDPIVFVPSAGGSAKPHFRYSYDEAIADGACRPVQFVEARGTTTFRTEDGVVHSVTFDDADLTEVGTKRRLRAALEWIEPGSIASKLLEDANDYIVALRRQGDSDAAGLVVCIDCEHAAAVADHMDSQLLGRRPIVACSHVHDPSDPAPANAIRTFGVSHDPWIVAVNMVSEGVDIPRLRAVVYLTNRLTLLSFRQIVGRVVRTDLSNANDHGRVYMPADPRLIRMAHAVTEAVDLLPPPIVIVTDGSEHDVVRIEGTEEPNSVPFATIETIGEEGEAFDTEGHDAEVLLVACARVFIEREGLAGTDPASLALAAAENPELRSSLLQLQDYL